MRSSIRRAKNWSRLHPQGADMLLTAALSILALVSSRAAVDFAEAAGPPGFDLPTLPQEVLGLVLTLGPLAFRRRAPIAAVLTCAGGFVVSRTLLDTQEASVVGVGISIAIYSAAAYGRPPWRNWACGVAGVAVLAELWRELATLAPDDQTNMVVVETFALLFYAALIVAIRRRPVAGYRRRHARRVAVTDVDPAPEYLGALSLRRPPARLHRRSDWASMVA